MSRKRLAALGLLACAALTTVGVAAASRFRAQSSQAVAATFAAGSISHARSTTCTAADGTYRETVATYDGTATSSDPRLNGRLTIRAHSVVNTTTGIGWTEGAFRVRGTGAGAHGTLRAAISGTHAVGSVVGSADHPQGKLVASVSSEFSQDAGFGSGSLGTGTAAGAGVVFQRGACTRANPVRTVSVARLAFRTPHGSHARIDGTLTLDVTRDSSGAITGANAVFYVNYRFGAATTITGLTVRQIVSGAVDPIVVDAGTGSIADGDGSGNLTRQVGVSGATAQALLANPRGYYARLTTSGASFDAALGGFARR